MQGLNQYDECDPDQSISCRVVWKLTSNETAADIAAWVIGKPLAIVGLVIIGTRGPVGLHRMIDRVVRRAEDGVLPGRVGKMTLGNVGGKGVKTSDPTAATRRVQRARTMGSLLKSISSGVIFTIILMMSISELGYDVAPLIAGAGIIGVALGFGAQSLVKDFLSGIFMIFEDQYGVGDVVDVGEASGTVEAVSLRVTRLRDVNGTVWYVRNGEILRVGNMSQNWARTVLDVGVAYSEDLREGTPGADGGRPRPVGRRGVQGPDHRGARGVGRRGAQPGRRDGPGDAQDRAAGAVGGRARDAPADQGPLRLRGHRDPVPAADDLAPRRAGPGRRSRRADAGRPTRE